MILHSRNARMAHNGEVWNSLTVRLWEPLRPKVRPITVGTVNSL